MVLPVLKFTLQVWWYNTSAAGRSLIDSMRPLLELAQLSFHRCKYFQHLFENPVFVLRMLQTLDHTHKKTVFRKVKRTILETHLTRRLFRAILLPFDTLNYTRVTVHASTFYMNRLSRCQTNTSPGTVVMRSLYIT